MKAPTNQLPAPTPGAEYQAQFVIYVQAVETLQATTAAMTSDLHDPEHGDVLIRAAAEQIFRWLIREAVTRFSPPGGELRLQSDPYKAAFLDPFVSRHRGSRDPREFDAVVLWSALERDLGQGRGAATTYRQAADRLFSFLQLRGETVARQGPWVVIRRSAWLSDGAYGHSFRDELRHAAPAFQVFAHWMGTPDLGEAYRTAASELDSYSRKVKSREKFTLGPDTEMITYQSALEFRFRGETASKLQLFLSQYHAE